MVDLGDTHEGETPLFSERRRYKSTRTLSSLPPTVALSQRWRRELLSSTYESPLDRVNVLKGHTGCVNALSWAEDGKLLLSGGDDTTVRLWRLDESNTTTAYPYVCQSVINTGHTANIFNAQMLPGSTRIVTVAGDRQVRVFDTAGAVSQADPMGSSETHYHDCCLRVFRCHKGRTKRVVTEESSDLFMTVGEDGTVRQHDLRVPHRCSSGCPPPLVKLHREMSTLALSPLRPYQIVVAGESPYGYLFDRRHSGRFLREEWGIPPNKEDVTTCVRRFGRRSRGSGEQKGREHITGARMTSTNSHEVLLSYNSDAVYLYSTQDDAEEEPRESAVHSPNGSIVPPNAKRRKVELLAELADLDADGDLLEDTDMHDVDQEEDDDASFVDDAAEDSDESGDHSDDDEFTEEVEDMEKWGLLRGMGAGYDNVPIIYPRRRFAGACNEETVKDVNFLGPDDSYVVSGSDDGNFFVWRKATGALHGIYEGDQHVVNVIEGHPHLPVVAVSGIDTTVKLFSPVQRNSVFSRTKDAEAILKRNQESSSRSMDLGSLFLHYSLALRDTTRDSEDEDEEGCRYQ
ncbi:WD40 repeat-like protein [Stereum hirsutum FP-91666 SS1]|uniref:WD40 repeat-like protein n=1 Tax=Stereum hirsutum (strain FP-91666) TaxID=721885 RepID=UPI000440ECEC|nr:WD40 repeat-like protein [Stereum hirsutum FP-91666 SS1]EIM88452.1 WD40 repeat-like protein [Stereum hirsutum FP-91666 SS1]